MEGGGGSTPLELEEDTLRLVSSSLSAIETALAEWDASEKPKDMERGTQYLRMSHCMLSAWSRESLLGRKDSKSARVRMKKFSEICRKLEAWRPE